MKIRPLAGLCARFVDIIESSFFDSDTSSVVANYVQVGRRYLDVRY